MPPRKPRRNDSHRHAIGDSAGHSPAMEKPEHAQDATSDWMAERLPGCADAEPGVVIDMNPHGDAHRGRARESKRGQR